MCLLLIEQAPTSTNIPEMHFKASSHTNRNERSHNMVPISMMDEEVSISLCEDSSSCPTVYRIEEKQWTVHANVPFNPCFRFEHTTWSVRTDRGNASAALSAAHARKLLAHQGHHSTHRLEPIGLDPLWIPRPWLSHADSVSPARETGRDGPRRDRSPFYLDVDPGPFRFERITQPQGVDRARDPRADVVGSSPFDDVPQHACTAKRSYLCAWNKSRRKKGSSLVAAEPLQAENTTATSQEKRAEESSDT